MKATRSVKHPCYFGLFTILTLLVLAIPTYAETETGEEDQDEGHIALSQEQIEHSDIGLSKVESGSLQEVLTVYGSVRSNPEKSQKISARFDGQIRKINKRIGDAVQRGEPLVSIQANDSMQNYPLVSMIDGVVTAREANIGEQTNGRTLLIIEDLSSVWIELSLFPLDISQVKTGQSVKVRSKNNDHSAEGVVSYISPIGNSGTQTVLARVPLNNPEQRWTPGQFVVGDVVLSEAVVPLLVETEALQIVENRPVIFVQSEEGFEPRPVQIGRSDGRSTEILAGLNSGETYVTRNSFVLKSELGKEDAEHGH
jgi:cobalt-zinc-cadmium efflux system membrane fusion protein